MNYLILIYTLGVAAVHTWLITAEARHEPRYRLSFWEILWEDITWPVWFPMWLLNEVKGELDNDD